MIKRDMRCAINPAVGDERFIHLRPAKKSCKVAVVGGGPAGMEAARVSTLRGHKGTVFERTGELGGAMLCCCTVTGKNKMQWYADWLRQQISKLDIEVKYCTEPKIKDLQGFDVILLAAGGRIAKPAMITDEQFRKSMEGIKLITGNRHRIKEEAPGAYKDIEEVVRIVIECGWAKAVARMAPLAVLKG